MVSGCKPHGYNLRMQPLALITHIGSPDLTDDDALLIEPLRRLDIEARAAAWDDAAQGWAACAGAVIRSPWNYYHHPEAFRRWIGWVEQAGEPLWNTPDVLRWNMDKVYLRDLAADGVPVVPTVWLECGQPADLSTLLTEQGWGRVVLKPAISGSADGAWQADRTQAPALQPRLEAMLRRGGALLQPFLPEIHTGEWSMIFFDDVYSHAVLKRPAPGGIFVQEEHGGTYMSVEPAAAIRDAALAVLSAAHRVAGGGPFLYARVDGVLLDGCFTLMELEVLEPALFLSTSPGAPERFAAAIRARLTSR